MRSSRLARLLGELPRGRLSQGELSEGAFVKRATREFSRFVCSACACIRPLHANGLQHGNQKFVFLRRSCLLTGDF